MHVARRFLIWWVLLMALWLELVSSSDWSYIVVGLGCSAASALAAVLAHLAMDKHYALDPRWLRWFLTALPGTVVDSLRLTRLLFRSHDERSAGTLRVVHLPNEDPRRGAGRRALAVIALGVAPGSYVVTITDNRLLLHELPGSGTTLVEQVQR